jgi:lactoylglutathione lyase
MINFNGIDHLNLTVSNLKNSIDFYNKLFGLRVFEEALYNGIPHAIIGKENGLFLCLYEAKSDLSLQKNRINHFGIHINEFDKTFRKVKNSGVPINYYGIIIYPNSRSFYIEDPDGNKIELTEYFGGQKSA